jgi:hypothetical protein
MIMGMSSIKKAKIPSKSAVTVTKSQERWRIKVGALKRSRTAVRPVSPTDVGYWNSKCATGVC